VLYKKRREGQCGTLVPAGQAVCGGYHNGTPEIPQRLIEVGWIDAEEAIVIAADPEDGMILWEGAKKESGL
jgi:hypothetical protein